MKKSHIIITLIIFVILIYTVHTFDNHNRYQIILINGDALIGYKLDTKTGEVWIITNSEQRKIPDQKE